MVKWIKGFLDRAFAVAGALLLSQAPLFMQQYQQRLAGHVAELQLQIEMMRQAAALSGKTLNQFVQKFLASQDLDFVRQGEIMQSMVQRWESLSEGYIAMNNAVPFLKPFVFLAHLNYEIAKTTFEAFNIGISLSLEGFVYALFGIIIGYFTFIGLCKLLQAIGFLFKPLLLSFKY